jgi:hypothetical protein
VLFMKATSAICGPNDMLSFRLAHGPRPASLSPKRLAAARFEIQTVLPRAALTNAGLA